MGPRGQLPGCIVNVNVRLCCVCVTACPCVGQAICERGNACCRATSRGQACDACRTPERDRERAHVPGQRRCPCQRVPGSGLSVSVLCVRVWPCGPSKPKVLNRAVTLTDRTQPGRADHARCPLKVLNSSSSSEAWIRPNRRLGKKVRAAPVHLAGLPLAVVQTVPLGYR